MATQELVDRKTFGRRLKLLRLGMDLTLEELERESRVPKSALSRWERGLVWPEVDRLYRVAAALHTTPDALIGLTDLPPDWASRARIKGFPQTLSA
jgi:transcriptional regulator with XRE-family HTH domain